MKRGVFVRLIRIAGIQIYFHRAARHADASSYTKPRNSMWDLPASSRNRPYWTQTNNLWTLQTRWGHVERPRDDLRRPSGLLLDEARKFL